MLAFFGILLYRYCGTAAIGFEVLTAIENPGGGAAARWHREGVDLDLADDPSLRVLAARLQDKAERDDSLPSKIACLVPVHIGRLFLSHPDADTNQATLELTFERAGTRPGWLTVTSSPEIYSSEAIHVFRGHCRNLMQAAFQNPDLPASELEMMNPEELHRIFVKQSGPAVAFEPATIPEAFERQVFRTPDNPAVEYNGKTVTYRELHARSLRIATSLQRHGVALETLIGVYLDDPLAIAITYLGIVISGGVFVPLDNEWPKERVEQVIAEAAMLFVITTDERAQTVRLDVGRVFDRSFAGFACLWPAIPKTDALAR